MKTTHFVLLLALLSTPMASQARLAEASAPVNGGDDELLAARVAAHYVEQAQVRYQDALDAAIRMLRAINAFLREPSEEAHLAAKEAWVEAHSIYSHAEVFRFGNPNVDAWETRVNAWPMDEGLIDYVAEGYIFHEGNPHALEDIIGKGRAPITDEIIAEWQSGTDPKSAPSTTFTDIESNVTRGYHAIEFLLWGQDRNQPPGTSGQREYTDYIVGEECTNGRCHRRRDYLSAAARLLVSDLRYILIDWNPEGVLYGKHFQSLSVEQQLERMVIGLGTLGFGELAGERIEVALLTFDQEEEQSCFSDKTHLAIHNNARSIETLYLGQHTMGDGKRVQGISLSQLVARLDPKLDETLRDQLAATTALSSTIAAEGEKGVHFDVMIREESGAHRERLFSLMDHLEAQTASFEKVQALLPQLAQL